MNAVDQLNRTILLCRDHVAVELSYEEICRSFQSMQVLLVSNAENLVSHSGQTALMTLVALLSRMGVQVSLAIPEVEMIYEQPPFGSSLLRKSLLASSELFIAGATVRQAIDVVPDLTFALGDTELSHGISADWRLVGEEWGGKVVPDGVHSAWAWKAEWPVGAMVSAALASGEVFKHVVRRLLPRSSADREFFQASRSSVWDLDGIAIPPGGIELGTVDIISAGAISQAALYALTRLPRVRMNGCIFDDDVTAPSNLNRNMLTLVGDLGSRKANLVSERCRANFLLEPIFRRFTKNVAEQRRIAPLVLVGVDDIPSRWQVQTCAPGIVTVSGTSHFSASSSSHGPGEPCCGCLHPVDDGIAFNEIPTISFVSFWAGLLMAVRVVRESVGMPYPQNRQHLWLTPLRMDLPHAAMWSPVFARKDCPVKCPASSLASPKAQASGST